MRWTVQSHLGAAEIDQIRLGTRGRLLVTGEGTADDECDVAQPPSLVRAYNGPARARISTGVQVATSDDLEVRYRVRRTGANLRCPPSDVVKPGP